jgi:hypothetical protein
VPEDDPEDPAEAEEVAGDGEEAAAEEVDDALSVLPLAAGMVLLASRESVR